MSTICTDRQLPPILDDYGKHHDNDEETMAEYTKKYGTELFDRLVKYVSCFQLFVYSFLFLNPFHTYMHTHIPMIYNFCTHFLID